MRAVIVVTCSATENTVRLKRPAKVLNKSCVMLQLCFNCSYGVLTLSPSVAGWLNRTRRDSGG